MSGASSLLEELLRVVQMRDYNTRVVVLGTMMLGLAAGVIGSFMLLRKRALLGDALSHATLPGIGLAFMCSVALGGDGKSLPLLLCGATITGVLGAGAVLFIRHFTRLKEDTALGIVLSVFFGAGIVILSVAQNMPTGHAAGLESFIFGKTASMLASDAMLIGAVAFAAVVLSALFFKEFGVVCFDQAYASSQGRSVALLDSIMVCLAIAVTVIGLQAVGLILVIAMLIVPAAAARFWTERLAAMVVIAGVLGAMSAAVGATASALYPNLPAGAMIVLAATGAFVVSLLLGRARGAIWRWVGHARTTSAVSRQNLLRAMYELCESRGCSTANGGTECILDSGSLMEKRSWSSRDLHRLLRRVEKEGLVGPRPGGGYALTPAGWIDAARVTRNHRLWEMYLITEADLAPGHVDRLAEDVEHVIGAEMVAKLERLLPRGDTTPRVPPSPHLIPDKIAPAGSTQRIGGAG